MVRFRGHMHIFTYVPGMPLHPPHAWVWCTVTEKVCGMPLHHKRSLKTQEKAKVVAAVWGTKFIQFSAALQIWHQADLKKRMNTYVEERTLGRMDASEKLMIIWFTVHTTPNYHPPKFFYFHICSACVQTCIIFGTDSVVRKE